MSTDNKRFMVDGVLYDRELYELSASAAVTGARFTGTSHNSPLDCPQIPDDECLCGTGFVCLVHGES